ncbi:MAG: PepSY-associated TM helix domain-containing protein [Gemmataceae bacterium]
MTPAYRRLLKVSRIVHVYLTLFGLVLILLFAVTGFMLNHEDWFLPTEPHTRTAEQTLPTGVLNPVDKFEVVEALRREFAIAGAVNTFRADDESVEVEFLRPGGRTVAEVRRETGVAVVTFETRGWAGVLTDLHKGKSAGRAWGLVIDGVCGLLLAISTTGLVLWWSLKARGKWGAAAMILGGALAGAIYYWLVP